MNVLDEVYELGVDEGKTEGRESAFFDMVRKGLVSASDAARELGIDERQVIERVNSTVAV